jgi:Flp pilus assembly CpaE family ATPase
VVDHRDLKDVRTLYPTESIYYFLNGLEEEASIKNIELVATGHNISPLANGLTTQQLVKEVMINEIGDNGNASNRIIGFFGSHSGSGVSTTTLNVARILGEMTKNSVAVLSLNTWDPSDYFLTYGDAGHLNDIRLDLKTHSLTPEKLRDSMRKYQYFYHLAGNRDIKLQRYYSTEELAHLIDIAKETFDVVLIDAGSHFDNAGYAQTYISSELKFFVTTQDEKGYRGYFSHVYDQLLKPLKRSSTEFILLINQFKQNYSLISEKDMQEELGMQLLTTIPDEDVNGLLALRQKKLLFDIGTEEYQRSIKIIANTIVKKANLLMKEKEQEEAKKKGLFHIFK